MRSANPSAPLQGLRLYKALLGLIQASGLAGGFDFYMTCAMKLPIFSAALSCICRVTWV